MYYARPDITYVVSTLSKYTSNHGKEHLNALVGILRCLQVTIDYELHFARYPTIIKGYNDVILNLDRKHSISVIA